MKEVQTFTASIYVGLQSGYSGIIHTVAVVEDACHEYVDEVGLCVTVTPTKFIYTNGAEPGAVVGLINYPRFELAPEQIESHAFELARRLQRVLGQFRVSIVMPHKTVMFEESTCAPS